jgi:hypothetical protein
MGLGEAAHRLGISYQQARALMFTRQLEAIHVSRFWLIDPRSVERYIAQRDGQEAEPPPKRRRSRVTA